MTVGSGQFRLFSRIEPPLKAGDYRFRSEQRLAATGHPEGALPVDGLDTHVRVRSPQYVLPPDQVLSTFPPAGREGSFGARLPQIVIRRRTLPWERRVVAGRDDLPWLALVVIAEGEADLLMNQDVAKCVTPGVELDTPADVEKGNCLQIRRSMVHRIFPTQEEVGLLAHAREVDLNDTELMMGDDDGFLAVVIANRLPVPGRDAEGRDTPVKYLACLVNLCEQFPKLLEKAPDPRKFTIRPEMAVEIATVGMAQGDHMVMGSVSHTAQVLGKGVDAKALDGKALGSTAFQKVSVDPVVAAPYENVAGWATASKVRGTADVYAEMARDFQIGGIVGELLDPVLTFPVLIHWSFTTVGDETFESLMKGLNSGLLGTTGETDPGDDPQARKPTVGRLPLEVVETGHVGLPHRLRRGDEVRSWYRGPLLPHPPDVDADRLPLAHAADQIRVVVPDGREDVSLAAAFEIGRLLGLSRTSMIAALMRWRQEGFQAARRTGTVGSSIFSGVEDMVLDRSLGGMLGALVGTAIVASPEAVLGNPSPLVSAGRPVLEDAAANQVLATGLGISAKAFEGDRGEVLGRIVEASPRLPRGDVLGTGVVRDVLAQRLDTDFARVAVQSLADEVVRGAPEIGAIRGLPLDLLPGLAGLAVSGFDPAIVTPHAKGGDALDRLVEDLAGRDEDEEEL
ncbi:MULTISPECIES: hypothetical protein [unclassified Nocardioides]|uniref:hypothetical protein n=1 Tax=unclassified Nocardioides TaxID=2615069 RepID=UPI003614CACE